MRRTHALASLAAVAVLQLAPFSAGLGFEIPLLPACAFRDFLRDNTGEDVCVNDRPVVITVPPTQEDVDYVRWVVEGEASEACRPVSGSWIVSSGILVVPPPCPGPPWCNDEAVANIACDYPPPPNGAYTVCDAYSPHVPETSTEVPVVRIGGEPVTVRTSACLSRIAYNNSVMFARCDAEHAAQLFCYDDDGVERCVAASSALGCVHPGDPCTGTSTTSLLAACAYAFGRNFVENGGFDYRTYFWSPIGGACTRHVVELGSDTSVATEGEHVLELAGPGGCGVEQEFNVAEDGTVLGEETPFRLSLAHAGSTARARWAFEWRDASHQRIRGYSAEADRVGPGEEWAESIRILAPKHAAYGRFAYWLTEGGSARVDGITLAARALVRTQPDAEDLL